MSIVCSDCTSYIYIGYHALDSKSKSFRPTHLRRAIFGPSQMSRPELIQGLVQGRPWYVHRVMHRCIMVKVGGKRKTQKVC